MGDKTTLQAIMSVDIVILMRQLAFLPTEGLRCLLDSGKVATQNGLDISEYLSV